MNFSTCAWTAAWITLAAGVGIASGTSEDALDAAASKEQTVRPVYLPPHIWSAAHGQDRLLVDHVLPFMPGGRQRGTFVEAGAYDGRTGSNMYALEHAFDWTGVCFEPNAKLFRSVVEQRGRCHNVNGLICSHNGLVHYVEFAPPYEQENGIVDFMDENKQKTVSSYPIERKTAYRCRNLENEVWKQLGTRAIDVLSLDVEGSEVSVLSAINLRELQIDVILVEVSHEDEVKRLLTRDELYVHVAKIGDDNVFFRQGSVYMSHYREGCACLRVGECHFKLVYPAAGWICPAASG